MTVVLTKEAPEGSARFLICPGQWFRGRRVVSVERDWTAGTVTVEVNL